MKTLNDFSSSQRTKKLAHFLDFTVLKRENFELDAVVTSHSDYLPIRRNSTFAETPMIIWKHFK